MIQKYIEWMKEKNYGPSALEGAAHILRRYDEYLNNNFHLKPTQVTEDHLEGYVLYLKQTLSNGTLRLHLSRIRGFHRFCHQRGAMLYDPTQNLIPLKKEQLLKSVPTEKTLKYLLDQPDEHTYHGIRDGAILELMYSSGLRNQETRDLKVGDVDLKEELVRVRSGKGCKGRTAPLGRKACALIQKYLLVTRPKYLRSPGEDHLFLTERGGSLPEWSINAILSRYKKTSELTKLITPHSLRHACALHMLRGGAPIQTVQAILGHKRISTTQIYTRLDSKDLKRAHQKFHPRERLAKRQ